MTDDAPLPYGMPAQRTPVEFDADTGHLRIGAHARPVPDPSEPSQVYGAYLSLLYAVRGAQPGEQLALRSADLEALLLIVGDDPDTIEKRLIGLMGCTADEATALSRVLLRHRKLTATLGVAAGLSLGVVAVAGGTSDSTPTQTRLVQPVGATSSSDIGTPVAPAAGTSAAAASTLPSPATTSVVLAAADAPVSGTSSGSDRAADAASGTADRQTARTVRRSVAAPTGAAPTVGDGRTATPTDTAPAPESQPAPSTGVDGPQQPDVDDVTDPLPVVPGRPISGTSPIGPGDSFTDPVIVGDDVPGPSGSTPPPASSTTPAPTDSAPTEPAPTEPAPTEPAPTEPAPTEPAPTEPGPTEPVQTEPVRTEPVQTEPVRTEPAPIEPAPTEPAPNEPTPSEAAPTEPAPTDPGPTEPVQTEPVRTDPAPTDGGTKKPKGGGMQGVTDSTDADKGKGNDKPA